MKSNYKNGSVIATSNGKYRAFFTNNGKRISKTFDSKQSAKDWLANNRSCVALGEWVEPNDMTFGQWIVECLKSSQKRLKESTMREYKNFAKKLTPLNRVKLQSLNGFQVQHVLDNIESKSAQVGVYRFLKVIIKKAIKMQLLRHDVMLQVEPPKYCPAKKDVFSKEEISRIYSVLEHSKYKAFFMLAFTSGCRVGEMLGLKINAVKDTFIRIDNSTTLYGRDGTVKSYSSQRDVILPKYILDMLRHEWEKRGAMLNGYIFSNLRNRPISRTTVFENWHKILLKAHVPFRNIHYIRHTHATQMLSNGVPILEVQHRLGHAFASTTLNRYGHVLTDNKDIVLEGIDKIMANL